MIAVGAGGNRRDAPAASAKRAAEWSERRSVSGTQRLERGAGGNRRDAPAPSAKR